MASSAYLVEPRARLREVVKAIESRFAVRREPARVVHETLLDTFDWRLFARGSSLRAISDGGSLSLRLESPKRELTCRLPDGELPGFAWDLPAGRLRKSVAQSIDVRRLLPQLEVELKVEPICLLNEDEKTVVRLNVRRGTATNSAGSGSRKQLPLVVALTPLKGYDRAMREAAGILEGSVGLHPIEESALDGALRATGVEPGNYVAKKTLELNPETPADEATIAICRSMLETMRANEDGLRRNLDSEFLHDFRVAVRRTRSVLRLMRGVLPAEARAHFKGEFKWLGSITSPVRDLDVYLLKMPEYRADLPEEMGQDLDPLDAYLHQHHSEERRRLNGRLKSKRYERLLTEWEAFLDRGSSGDGSSPDAARPIAEVASERIWKAYRRAYKRGRKIGPDSPATELHELRLDCKSLRYLLEFFRSLYDAEEMTRFIGVLRQLQDNLGDFNDLDVQQASLRKFAQEMSDEGLASVESVLAMGRLVEHLAQRQVAERLRFAECWRDFSSAANQKSSRHMFRDAAADTS